MCFLYFFKAFNDSELISILCNGVVSGEKYPESVRLFCLSLYYCSPKAYQHVRAEFNNHLPHSKTIKQWYANSDASGEPGIQKECMDKLKRIGQAYERENNKKLMCSLVFDEMYIRKQVYWCWHQENYAGFVNHGQKQDSDTNEIASQAIVFILNGVNASFEYPVAYYFINKLNGAQKRDLTLDIIEAVTQCEIKVTNLTFDGDKANLAMCTLLGANLDVESDFFHPYLFNPINGEKIYIVLDPCHAEKLVRNTLAGKKIIYTENGQIEWRYFESLYEFSKDSKLRTHKFTKQHLQWTGCKMNVRVACQTLSNSVANSMQFLLDQNRPQFAGAKETIRLEEKFRIRTLLKRLSLLKNYFHIV